VKLLERAAYREKVTLLKSKVNEFNIHYDTPIVTRGEQSPMVKSSW